MTMVASKSKRLLSLLAISLLSLSLPNNNNICVHAAQNQNGKIIDDPTPPTAETVEAEVAVAAKKGSALMGKLFPLFGKLFRTGNNGGLSTAQVFKAVADLVDEREVAIFAAVGWGLVPITKGVYDVIANVTASRLGLDDDDIEGAEEDVVDAANKKSKLMYAYDSITGGGASSSDNSSSEVTTTKPKHKRMKPFKETTFFHVVDHVSQASKIGISVIAVDCVALISKMMGYNPWNIMERASRVVSRVLYTGWITYRLQLMKRFFLERSFGHNEDSDLGKMVVVDNLLDGAFYLIWMYQMLNYLEVETGVAAKSLFSLGATGTLVFGLASKDIASQLMGGITLHLSDKMFEGDDVRFSDGTSGKVQKMGWFETMIRNSDELVVGIPNTQLSAQRIYNLSRTPRSQVKQELRVSYDDAAKIPKLLEAIKEEIKKDCPKLITDGSRPFRAHWRDYKHDHLEVVVDCHFMIKPTGNEYWDNRQTMLEAIYRAAKNTGVHFEQLGRAVLA